MNPSELIEQLRGHADRIEPAPHRFVCEAQDIRCAADTIDQLSAEVERLREAQDKAWRRAECAESNSNALAQRVAELEARCDREAEMRHRYESGFKNFHRSLCERFGYGHDEVDWTRDQVSLMEHIAERLREAEARAVPDEEVLLELFQGIYETEWDNYAESSNRVTGFRRLAEKHAMRCGIREIVRLITATPPHGKDAQGGV